MDRRKLWVTARWEFIQKGKTKAFLLSLILTPILIAAFAVLPSLLTMEETDRPVTLYVIDATGRYGRLLDSLLARKYVLPSGEPRYDVVTLSTASVIDDSLQQLAIRHILDGRAEGLLLIPPTFDSTRTVELWSKKAGDFRLLDRIEAALQQLRVTYILQRYQLPAEIAQVIQQSVRLLPRKVTAEGKVETTKGFFAQFFGAYLGALLLFLLVMTSAQLLVRSILEEKMNRLIEILLSSTSPLNLMLGKMLGLGGLSIVQALVWLVIALGIASATPFSMATELFHSLPIIIVYVILGYLLYAALLIALGSLATTEQEAQNITGYTVMFLVLPIAFIAPIMQNPDALWIRILSYVPFFTPTMMTVRWHLTVVPWWEVVITIGMLLFSTLGIGWLGAKIFRIAILSYGKRLTLPEVIRLIRAARV